MSMSRRLPILALALASCVEHAPEWYGLTDEATAKTTSESTSNHAPPTESVTAADATSSDGGTGGSADNTATSAGDDTVAWPTADDTTATTSDTGETSTGLPIDPPPTVTDLVCDPKQADEVGPVSCTYKASADAIEADLLDDGEVVATGPAGAPLIFSVISASHNNPGSEITVVVRDAVGQTAETAIFQPSAVQEPGSEVWTKLEPNDGVASTAHAVAFQGDHVITAGIHWKNPLVVGTLRRYDVGGEWDSDDGWSMLHSEWTELEWMKTGNFGPTGLAVDAGGNIILVGLGYDGGQPRSYVARFLPDGTLDWEKPGNVGTEARAVGVQPDGTIWVAGAKRTGVGPERWDMEVSVFGPDKTAYGIFPYSGPEDDDKTFNERGRSVTVLKNGRVVIGGTREIPNPNNQNLWFTRGVALLFEGKGKFIDVWTSGGDKLENDAILASVATDEGFATCGYAEANPNDPGSKKQILIRWHGEDLQEIKAPRLEATSGAAICNALGYNMEGATIVGAQVYKNGQNNNQWIFAVDDAASLLNSYRDHNGAGSGDDRVQALTCKYKCAWVGGETVDGAVQWIAGVFRG